jgi:hypothetical protein
MRLPGGVTFGRKVATRCERRGRGLTPSYVGHSSISIRIRILVVMASSNVDLVRSIYAAWERGDFTSAEWADPDIELVLAGGPDSGELDGLVGIAEGFREFVSAWEDWRLKAEDCVELDSERALALVHISGRGKTAD